MNGDALSPCNRAEQPIDGVAHARQQERIVELSELRPQEPRDRVCRIDAPLAEQTRDDSRQSRRDDHGPGAVIVARDIFPAATLHQSP
jgi:hypothetical protein